MTLIDKLKKLRAELALGGDSEASSMVGEAIEEINKLAKRLQAVQGLCAEAERNASNG